jgi:hypothetical protein
VRRRGKFFLQKFAANRLTKNPSRDTLFFMRNARTADILQLFSPSPLQTSASPPPYDSVTEFSRFRERRAAASSLISTKYIQNKPALRHRKHAAFFTPNTGRYGAYNPVANTNTQEKS